MHHQACKHARLHDDKGADSKPVINTDSKQGDEKKSNSVENQNSNNSEISPEIAKITETENSPPCQNKNLSGFDELWDVYPKQQGKKLAEVAYRNLIRGGKNHAEMVRGAIEYREHVKAKETSQEYVKSLENWLKEERWSDKYQQNMPSWKEIAFKLMGRVEGRIGNEHCPFYAEPGESDQDWAFRVKLMLKVGMDKNWDVVKQAWTCIDTARRGWRLVKAEESKMLEAA